MARSTHRIGAGTAVNGSVEGVGDLVIAGAVVGALRIDGAVRVEPGASVRSQDQSAIQGASLEIAGDVTGIAQATQVARLRSGATLEGALVAPRVLVEAGARVRGWIETTEGWERPVPASTAASGSTPAPRENAAPPEAGLPEPVTSSDDAAPVSPAAAPSDASPDASDAEPPTDSLEEAAEAAAVPSEVAIEAPGTSAPAIVPDEAPASNRSAPKGKRR